MTFAVDKLVNSFLKNWNDGDLADLAESYQEDFTYQMPGSMSELSLHDYREWIRVMRTAYPDLKIEIANKVYADNQLALQWRFTGTNDGALRHSQATGKSVKIYGMTLLFLHNGKFSQGYWYYDVIDVYRQLDRIPSIYVSPA